MKPALHPVFISFKLDPKDLLLIRCLRWHPAELTGSSSTLPAPNVFSEGLHQTGLLWLAVLHLKSKKVLFGQNTPIVALTIKLTFLYTGTKD